MQVTLAGIKVGPVLLSSFGLIVITGVLVGVAITWHRARGSGQGLTLALDLGAATLFYGLVIGRLFYVWSPPPSAAPYYTREWYFSHPLDLLAGPVAIWNGGLGTSGMIVGACLGAILALRERRLDVWAWADTVAPGILAAAAILPWANLAAGQLLGPATALPWGVPGMNAGTSAFVSPDIRYHPTPAYMSLWTALAFAVTAAARRQSGREWPPGLWSLVAGAMFFPGLFLADMLCVDVSRSILGLSGAQLLSLLIEAGLFGLILWRSRTKPELTTEVTKFTEN